MGQIVPDMMLDAPWPLLPQITGRQATELFGSAEGMKRLEEIYEGGTMPTHSVGDQRWTQTGENSAGDPMYSRSTYYEDISVTGAAAELAAELGVDLSTVEGTGKGGNITKADVQKAANG